jgi:hypothetical protein
MTTEDKKAVTMRKATGFAIVDLPEAKEDMIIAFDQLGINDRLLSRIKVPAGGMTAWEVEDIEGTQVHQHLDVIIVAMKGRQKAWWPSTMDEGGGGSPPSCVSSDGKYGFGVNALGEDAVEGKNLCAECAWNKFGSSRSGGNGKDCKDFALLFFFREGSRIPSLLQVPATSLKVLQNYVIRLIDGGKQFTGCVSRLGLKKTQSQGGITYSTLDLSWVSDLDAEAAAAMKSVGKEFLARIDDYNAFDESQDA